MRMRVMAGMVAVWCVMAATAAWGQGRARWTAAEANGWYAKQPWLVGANFVPSDAINELEMFQAATFDPALIDKELGMAEGIGMNTMRVFLQDQLWTSDPEGFKGRLNEFLTIAARHHIRPLLVLFDSCWETDPHLGPQHPPIPGVHNSGWVQSPGKRELLDRGYEPKLEAYVVGVVGAFAKDDRVLGWDVWNEPDNRGGDVVADEPAKVARVNELLPKAFGWARSANPTQPLTSGVWEGNWSDPAKESATTKIQLAESDVISFHNYGWPEEFEARIRELQPTGRPVLCTEYMARGAGSTFDGSLPIAKKYHVAAINWGLVAGKTQTYLPWDSWQRPYVLIQPTIWFHEVFRQDDAPYREHEVELIRELTGRGTGATAGVSAGAGTEEGVSLDEGLAAGETGGRGVAEAERPTRGARGGRARPDERRDGRGDAEAAAAVGHGDDQRDVWADGWVRGGDAAGDAGGPGDGRGTDRGDHGDGAVAWVLGVSAGADAGCAV